MSDVERSSICTATKFSLQTKAIDVHHVATGFLKLSSPLLQVPLLLLQVPQVSKFLQKNKETRKGELREVTFIERRLTILFFRFLSSSPFPFPFPFTVINAKIILTRRSTDSQKKKNITSNLRERGERIFLG